MILNIITWYLSQVHHLYLKRIVNQSFTEIFQDIVNLFDMIPNPYSCNNKIYDIMKHTSSFVHAYAFREHT